MTADKTDTTHSASRPRATTFVRVGLTAVCVAIAAMWVYAFGFAPRESANRIKDTAWQERAEKLCAANAEERAQLANLVKIDSNDPVALNQRADLVEKATNGLDDMIDEIAATPPTDEKGRAIVPLWIADYRTYIEDRRDYIAQLRTGEFEMFAESMVEGVPISERLAKFARENDAESCQPPLDLVS